MIERCVVSVSVGCSITVNESLTEPRREASLGESLISTLTAEGILTVERKKLQTELRRINHGPKVWSVRLNREVSIASPLETYRRRNRALAWRALHRELF